MNLVDIAALLSQSAKNPLPPQLAGWDAQHVVARMGTVFAPPYAPVVQDAVYGTPTIADEEPEELDHVSVSNSTDVQTQQVVSLSRSSQSMVTWSVTQGVHTSETIGVTVGYPPYFGLQFGTSASTDLSATNSSQTAEGKTWSWSNTIPVPPHRRVVMTLRLNKTRTDIPFEGRLYLMGRIWYDGTPDFLTGHPFAVKDIEGPGYGFLFQKQPHPDVEVVSIWAIKVRVKGVFSGIVGTGVECLAQEFDLTTNSPDGPAKIVGSASVKHG